MFKNVRIGSSLYSLIGFLSLLVVAIGIVGLRGIKKNADAVQSIYTDRLVPIEQLSAINAMQKDNITELLLALSRDPELAVNKVHEADSITKYTDAVEAKIKEIDNIFEQYKRAAITPEGQRLVNSYTEGRDRFVNNGLFPAITLLKDNRFDDANIQITTKAVPLYMQAEQEFEKLIQLQIALSKEEKDRADATYAQTRELAITSIVLGIVFAAGIGYWLVRNISHRVAVGIAALASTSTEIASTVEQHERSAANQASSVNETTTTMDELNYSSRQSAEQADAVADMAKQALITTEEGVKMALDAAEGMSRTKEKVGEIGEQILHLSEQTAQIGGIATAVTDIAGQINMLALNAAVEAVRAGEQGKGFAVIAQEVRKLAEQGKKSADKVNTIVDKIQKATNSVVMVTEEGTKTAQEVAEIARKVGSAFTSLADMANNVNESAQQVSLNAKQQVAAIKQVTEAMNQINAGAKDTAAGISQTKIGIQRIDEAAQNLKGMV